MIIGISGLAGSGKSSLSTELQKITCGKVIPFAAGVKAVALHLNWDGKKDKSGRRLLQVIGQGARDYDTDIWVKQWEHKLLAVIRSGRNILADDVRYPNEVAMIKEYDGVLIKVIGRGGLEGTAGGHESEQNMDDSLFDYIVDNSGDYDTLIHKARELVQRIDKEMR